MRRSPLGIELDCAAEIGGKLGSLADRAHALARCQRRTLEWQPEWLLAARWSSRTLPRPRRSADEPRDDLALALLGGLEDVKLFGREVLFDGLLH